MYKCQICNIDIENPPKISRELTMVGWKFTGEVEVCPKCGHDIYILENKNVIKTTHHENI